MTKSNHILKGFLYLAVPLLTIATIIGCSTEKEAWLNRGYHNMTAHYNGYFNAKEEIRLSLKNYNEQYQEDYTEILPVYHYPSDEGVGAVKEAMEVAIEKTSVVISKNSMPNPEKSKRTKREEWCKWIDDNWFVMAQANFYKRDYATATKLLKYIKTTYPTQEIVFKADLWLVKTAIASEDYATALSGLEQLEQKVKNIEGGTFIVNKRRSSYSKHEDYDIARPLGQEPPPIPKNFKRDMELVYADMHIKRGELNLAADRLREALTHKMKKRDRARYTFILGQIYQELGDNTSATGYYTQVTKLTPPYEMEFYARIYRALLFNGGDSKGLRAELNKMLRDEKNKDYLDQIYFALAEIDFAEGKDEQAIEHLKLSAANSTTNTKQKAKTYIRLGDVHYEIKEFPLAKSYYDSCLTVIDDTYESYEMITERSEGLTELVENLNTYQKQDSLLTLVEKGEKYYMDKIDKIIEEKKRKEEEEFNRRQNQPTSTGNTSSQDFGSGANWYFYNEQAKAFGFNEFKQVWGDRPLEDDWRRSDKNSVNFDTEEELDTTLTETEQDPNHPDYYLKNLPLSEEQQEAANSDIASALYKIGVIYKEKLGEPKRAEKYFLMLANRFQDSELGLPGMYQLYLAYKADNKTSESDKYKNIILENFPESEYAKIIRNPDFKEQEHLARKKFEEEYGKIFELYEGGQYDATISKSDEVLSRREINPLTPKILLLKAFALGAKDAENLDAISEPLEKIVEGYEDTEEGARAKNILERLRNQSSIEDVSSGNSNYVYNGQMEHFFVLVVPDGKENLNPIKSKISDFNSALFGTRDLKTNSTFLGTDKQIIVVRSFPNKEAAMQYHKIFVKDRNRVKDINSTYESFVITHKNYAAFYVARDLEGYLEFFKKNYE